MGSQSRTRLSDFYSMRRASRQITPVVPCHCSPDSALQVAHGNGKSSRSPRVSPRHLQPNLQRHLQPPSSRGEASGCRLGGLCTLRAGLLRGLWPYSLKQAWIPAPALLLDEQPQIIQRLRTSVSSSAKWELLSRRLS